MCNTLRQSLARIYINVYIYIYVIYLCDDSGRVVLSDRIVGEYTYIYNYIYIYIYIYICTCAMTPDV